MPFRFGFQCTSADIGQVLRDARRAEQAGFDIFQLGDHVGEQLSPLAALTAAAGVTARIRLGTLVLNNDLRHPFLLAQELATLDHVSDGRLEVGVGAGHSFTEYRALGLAFDPPKIRKERLAESVEILRSLLDGDPTTWQGGYYKLENATVLRPRQAHVPLLVGVNGDAALAHAARHADVVAPTMLGRTLPDGQHHAVRWDSSRLDETVAWIQDAAGPGSVSLHALVQAVVVTPDRAGAAEEVAARLAMDVSDVVETPFLCLGTHDEIAEHLLTCRQRWGFEYFTVRHIDEFEPVMQRLRTRERALS